MATKVTVVGAVILFACFVSCDIVGNNGDDKCIRCADPDIEIEQCPIEEMELLDFTTVLYDQATNENGEVAWFYNYEPAWLGNFESNYTVYLSILPRYDAEPNFEKHMTIVKGVYLSSAYPDNPKFGYICTAEINRNETYSASDGYWVDYRLPITFSSLGSNYVTITFYQPCQKKWYRLPQLHFILHEDQCDNEQFPLCGGRVELHYVM